MLFLEPLILTGGPLYQMNLLKNNLKHDKLPYQKLFVEGHIRGVAGGATDHLLRLHAQ